MKIHNPAGRISNLHAFHREHLTFSWKYQSHLADVSPSVRYPSRPQLSWYFRMKENPALFFRARWILPKGVRDIAAILQNMLSPRVIGIPYKPYTPPTGVFGWLFSNRTCKHQSLSTVARSFQASFKMSGINSISKSLTA